MMKKHFININKQRKIGIALSYITMGLSTVVSLVYTPFMLRCLGKNEYGLYQLIGSLSQYLSLLSLGLSGSYIRFHAKFNEKEGEEGVKKLNGLYLTVFSIISILAILIGVFMTINLPIFFNQSMDEHELRSGQIMMFIMTLNATITLSMTIFTSYIAANERFIFQRVVRLVYAIFHPILCVVALYFGGKASSLVLIALFCTVVMVFSEVIFCIKVLKFRGSLKGISFLDFKELFAFSVFVLLNDIINQVNWSIDKVILGYYSGTASVAVYGIASQLNTYYLSISTTISSVYAPQINRIAAGSDTGVEKNIHLNNVFFNVGRIQSFVMLLVISGYIFFGRQFIELWAGSGYEESYYIGLWLMIPAVIPLIQNTGIEIQRARNKHKTRTIVYTFIAIGNVFLSIPLCQIMGATGCAIGTAVSLVLGNILFMNWYYYKKLDIDIPAFWQRILSMFPSMIVPMIFGVFAMLNFNVNNYFELLICIVLYVLIYLISIYVFAMNNHEKKQIMNILSRFSIRERKTKE